MLNVKDPPYNAVGDGITDDTVAINSAIIDSVVNKQKLIFPSSTYIMSNLNALPSMKLQGEHVNGSIIKLKNGTNATLVNSATTSINDVSITDLTFDGNSANNTAGDVLNIFGSRPYLENLIIINAAGNGIITNFNLADTQRLYGCDGYFSRIAIDKSQKSGWVHRGPSDSEFNCIIISDSSLMTTNAYYHMYLAGATFTGNGRFFNLHTYNRGTAPNIPTVGVYIQSGGNNFSSCHFESGNTPLGIVGNGNNLSGCSYYAPRSTYAVQLLGSGNVVTGVVGLGFAASNPNYKGLLLQGSGNIVDLVNAGGGCTLGLVDFSGGQRNIVRLSGQMIGVPYNGTPSASEEVIVNMIGSPIYRHLAT